MASSSKAVDVGIDEDNFDEFDEDDRFRMHCAAPEEQKTVDCDADHFDEFDEDDRFRQHCMTEESGENDLKVLDFDECDEEARLAVHNATIESEPTERDVAMTDDASQPRDICPSGRPAIYFGAPEETPAEVEAARSREEIAAERKSRLAWSSSKAPPEESQPEETRPPPARPEPRLDPYARAMAAAKDHIAHAKSVARGPQPAAPPPPSSLAEVRAEAGADVAAAATAAEEETVAAQRGGTRRLPGLSACRNVRSSTSTSASASAAPAPAAAPSPSRPKGGAKGGDAKSTASNSTLSLQSALLSASVRRGTWYGVSTTRGGGDAAGDAEAEAKAAEPAGAAAPLDGNVEGASAALMRQTAERFRSRLEAERKGSDEAGAAARGGAGEQGPPLDSILCSDDVVRELHPSCAATLTWHNPLRATPPHQVCELLGWTGLESTAAAAQVCSQWRRLLAHGAVWQLLCRRARGADGQLLCGTPRLRVPTQASEPATADDRQDAGRAQRTATHAETQPVAAASEAAGEAASEAAGAAGAAAGAAGLTLTITAGAVGAAGLTLTITVGAAAGALGEAAGEAAGETAGEAAGEAAEDGWRRRGLLLQTEEAALRRRWHSSTCEESSHQPHSEHIMGLQLHRGLLVTCSADRTIALAELPRDSVALADADHPTGRGGSSGGGGGSRGGDTIGPTAVLHGHDDQVTRPHARFPPPTPYPEPRALPPWAS